MIKINIIILIIVAITNFNALAEEKKHSNHAHNNEFENLDTVILQAGHIDPNGAIMEVEVEGLVCDFCAKAIEKVFMKKGEVAGITVNLAKQNVIIALKENMDIEDNKIEELFLNAGYNITKINRKKL